jgi:hypothetical protein
VGDVEAAELLDELGEGVVEVGSGLAEGLGDDVSDGEGDGVSPGTRLADVELSFVV